MKISNGSLLSKAIGSLLFLGWSALSGQQAVYTFSTAGATGSVGPTQTQVNLAYASTNLNGSVQVSPTGIQTWTVPTAGPFRITVKGASGGNTNSTYNNKGGKGTFIQGEFNLQQGDVIQVLVGQRGVDGCGTGGGGGGTYVVCNNQLLIAAGGGGGATSDNDGGDATTQNDGTNDYPGGQIPGGTNGGGGHACNSSVNNGGGGGGYSGDGFTSTGGTPVGGGGLSFLSGGTGGSGNAPGGFGGGGGGTNCTVGGGGGGGYSGGAGGQQVNYCYSGTNRSGGGGGGSYNTGANQTNSVLTVEGDGIAIFESLCDVDLVASSNPICFGESVVLSTNAGANILWSNGATTNTIQVTPTVSTQYNVQGISADQTACASTVYITVTVNPLPNLVATSFPTVVCQGNTGTLSASGGISYTWTPGNDFGNQITANPLSSTVYTVKGQNLFGCDNTATVSLNVNTNQLVLSPDTTICQGDPAFLRANGAVSYLWSVSVPFNTVTVLPATSTVYSITAIDIHDCPHTGSISVNVNPTPQVNATAVNSVVCSGEVIQLSASGASSYLWNTGATGPSIDLVAGIDIPHFFDVTGTDNNGCSSTASVSVLVKACVSVEEIAGSSIRLLPNPAGDHIRIESAEGVQFKIFDLAGRMILEGKADAGTHPVNISSLSPGTYLVKLETAGGTQSTRLIKY